MPAKRRIGIVLAYDKSEFGPKDRRLLQALAPHIDFVKIGLEAMTAETRSGKTVARQVREFVVEVLEKKIMWDMKFGDIENTVAKAVRNIAANGVHMFTLHATISDPALRAAAAAANGTLPLAVTVLTDLDEPQCLSRFGRKPGQAVLDFARNASKNGVGGVVCSPKELELLMNDDITRSMKKVIPGIRPDWAQANDQKRTMTPGEAARAGADHVVIGRPIMDPPQAIGSPVSAARMIREELDDALA